MARSLPSLLVAYFAFSITALSIPPLPRPRLPDFLTVGPSHVHAQQTPLLDTLDIWIEQERKVALERLLANIKPGGRNTEVRDGDVKKVVDGTVLASPSRDHPDYFYQWVRDAAITMNSLADMYNNDPSSAFSSKLSAIIDAYAKLQGKIQHTNNPSGSFDDLQGLGEPKFQVDGTPFEASWGRPQRDGPALRATTLIRYLRAYNASHPTLWASPQSDDFFKPLYEAKMPPKSVIKADLEYVSHYWNQSSFDLWEEIEGLHFFTLMVSSRALKEGAQLARTFGDNGAAEWYEEQASYIDNTLQQFWDNEKGHLVETLESDRSGLDCGLLLGTLHALPTQGTKLKPTYPPWSDEILVSLLALTRDQHDRFPINSKYSDWNENAEDENPSSTFRFQGTGLGRYPEDVYDGYGTSYRGGNPWFLCTSSAAEVLYQTATHISRVSNLTITSKNHPFFSSLLSTSSLQHSLEVDASYGPSDALFHSVIERLAEAGDEFLEVVKRHVDESGGMSEQFDRRSGYMRGAGDLTWSYGAFLMAGKGRAAMHEELGREE